MEKDGIALMREDMARDEERHDDGADGAPPMTLEERMDRVLNHSQTPYMRTERDRDYDRKVWGIEN